MKKLSIILGLVLVFALSGCSSSEETMDVTETMTEEETQEETTDVTEEEVGENTSEESKQSEPDADETDSEEQESAENVLLLPDTLPDGLGNEIAFSDYEGKMLFVNFFGTWCTYCMQEMPDFQKFTENYADSASIVIVNALETENTDMDGVLRWYEENNYTMQMVFDIDRSRTAEFYGAIQGFPTTFVYDENQNFVGYIPGMMDYAMLENIVSEYSVK